MNKHAAETLYLVDGTSQLFRAYFALPGLTNAEGLPTNAIYGFTNMMRKLMKDEQPRYLGVAFDLPEPVFRKQAYAEYKANRTPTPEDLVRQIPYAKQVCELIGTTVLEKPGFEADDLIAALAHQATASGMNVVVVASDKDLLQLVDDRVTVFNPSKNLRLDPAGVESTFGAPPQRVRDVLGLMGDSVDNIPGVPGVGEKTALACVRSYGDIEAIIARAARFVALYDARNVVLDGIVEVVAGESLEEETAARVEQSLSDFDAALVDFLDLESDPASTQRAERARDAVGALERPALAGAIGQPGKKAARLLAAVKREFKALDRGSSRKIWYAIHEYAEQARLSKQLATLDREFETGATPEQLALRAPDRSALRELFGSLGFSALVGEYADDDDDTSEVEAPAASASTHRILWDRESLVEWVDRCRDAGEFALHVVCDEGSPMQARPIGLGLALDGGEAVYLPLAHETIDAAEQLSTQVAAECLAPLMSDPQVAKIVHGLTTAAHVMRRHGMPVCGWRLDTMVGAFLLHAGRSAYDLERLSREYLGRDPLSDESVFGQGAKRIGAARVDVERFAPYAAERTELTLRLAGTLRARLVEAGLDELYDTVDGPLLPLLVEMEAHGIFVDVELLSGMSAEMQRGIEQQRGEIHRLAGVEFNVDSPKQLREVLFERMGLKAGRKTAKSKVASTDAQTLEELAAGQPIAQKLLAYRELTKLKGTYVDTLPLLVNPETGRVHTRYHATGAATGRLSSSDPNVQNIPARSPAGRKIRAAFVAAPGFVFLASDYSQIELRVLAHLAGDADLIEAFRSGEDIHRHTASRIFGVAVDLVADGMRTRAKAVNFGILYGMSESRLAREQGMKRTDAREFIKSYFERFSSVQDYIEAVREAALRDGAVRTMFGRVRYFPQLHQRVNRAVREQALRGAVNTTIQGTAADLMKMAMLRVSARLKASRLGARMLLQVHDELLLEVPRDEIDVTRREVGQAMEQVARLEVPLVVDQKTGPDWLEVS